MKKVVKIEYIKAVVVPKATNTSMFADLFLSDFIAPLRKKDPAIEYCPIAKKNNKRFLSKEGAINQLIGVIMSINISEAVKILKRYFISFLCRSISLSSVPADFSIAYPNFLIS
ncbi:hypothetical protein ES703_82396 [subsurface metagenome]